MRRWTSSHNRLSGSGCRPYVIHLGIDHPPLGGLGYVLSAREMLEQATARGVGFEAVVCASDRAASSASWFSRAWEP